MPEGGAVSLSCFERSAPWAGVGLGANLGQPVETLVQAIAALTQAPGLRLLGVSGLWRSAPVQASGPDFFNAVAVLQASMSPLALLGLLQDIENRHGRVRPYRNAPRTLDLDLLFCGESVLDTPELTLPHPRMHLRAFVLEPLLSLCPGLALPGLGALEVYRAGLRGQVLEAVHADAVPEWPQQALAKG